MAKLQAKDPVGPGFHVVPLQNGLQEVKIQASLVDCMQGDGNCGFHAVAQLVFGDQDKWAKVRRDLLELLRMCPAAYAIEKHGLTLEAMEKTLSWFEGSAPPDHWYDTAMHAQLTADKYNAFVVVFQENSRLSIWCHSCWSLKADPEVSILEGIKQPHARVLGLKYGGFHWDYVRCTSAELRKAIADSKGLCCRNAAA